LQKVSQKFCGQPKSQPPRYQYLDWSKGSPTASPRDDCNRSRRCRVLSRSTSGEYSAGKLIHREIADASFRQKFDSHIDRLWNGGAGNRFLILIRPNETLLRRDHFDIGGPIERRRQGFDRAPRSPDGAEPIFQSRGRDEPEQTQLARAGVRHLMLQPPALRRFQQTKDVGRTYQRDIPALALG